MPMPALGAASAFSSIKAGVNSLLGKAPPDRKASLKLRRIFKRAQAGDAEAVAELRRRATEQGSKFKNINAKARKYYGMVTGTYREGAPQWSSPTAAQEGAESSSATTSTPGVTSSRPIPMRPGLGSAVPSTQASQCAGAAVIDASIGGRGGA